MKNITVSLDDETYRRARVRAAELDTSVSALVRKFLTELATEETEFAKLKREERSLREQVARFSAGDRLGRAALHERIGP
jgi:plasmid stability protein